MKQNGMTLVELMVAMLIGLGITLAISSVLIGSENHKRTTTSTNDAQQTGSYGYYALDKALRGAGSSIAGSAFPTDVGVLGCHLNAGAIFPRAGAFPAPFAAFLGGAPTNMRVAPVLIGKNQSQDGVSDVIMVMSGSGSAGGVSRQITGGGSAITATLDNTVGFANNDLVLVSQSGVADCLMEQVASLAPPTLNLAGIYYTATAATTSMVALAGSTSSYVTPIGNAAANNVQFMLFGVDNNRTLYSYDLLQNLNLVGGAGADSAQAIADGVVQMNALYGIDTNGDGIQDEWAGPRRNPCLGYQHRHDFARAHETDRLGAHRTGGARPILRLEWRHGGCPQSGFPAARSRFSTAWSMAAAPRSRSSINLNATEQQFRYRVFEFTVPLRNMLLLAGGP